VGVSEVVPKLGGSVRACLPDFGTPSTRSGRSSQERGGGRSEAVGVVDPRVVLGAGVLISPMSI